MTFEVCRQNVPELREENCLFVRADLLEEPPDRFVGGSIRWDRPSAALLIPTGPNKSQSGTTHTVIVEKKKTDFKANKFKSMMCLETGRV